MISSRIKWISAGSLIFIGILVGIILTANMNWTQHGYAGENTPVLGSQEKIPESLKNARNLNEAFVAVAKEIVPTVVTISTSRMVRSSQGGEGLPPFLRDLFGYEAPSQQARPQYGLGSGVIISKEGYILTNHHVIEGADDIQVTLPDKRNFKAELVGTDPLTEVAVIRIKADGLPVARLGDSETLEVGEWVVAVGNPLELSSTVTAGIVSAKGRNINIIGSDIDADRGFAIENFIQTDAAINRGNSGGPLVNLKAEVIGVNTAIASGTGFYAGYGFAIPINLARKIMEDLIGKGYVVRAYMGVSMTEVTEEMAEYFGMDRPTGVMIQSVVDDSPAESAGLRERDVILKIDGIAVSQSNEIQSRIAVKNPGETVALTILRDKKERIIRLTLGQRETGRETAQQNQTDEVPSLGLTVRELTNAIRSQLGWYENDEGVLVSEVEARSAAAEANIVRGSIIMKIEQDVIRSVADYRRSISKYEKGKVVLFTCKYRDTEYSAFVRLPK